MSQMKICTGIAWAVSLGDSNRKERRTAVQDTVLLKTNGLMNISVGVEK